MLMEKVVDAHLGKHLQSSNLPQTTTVDVQEDAVNRHGDTQ